MKRLIIITIAILIIVAADSSSARQPRNRRNPFAPLGEVKTSNKVKLVKKQGKITAPEKIDLRLNAIVWNKDNPIAIINNTVVKIGSEIAGRKISTITPQYVELEYNEQKEILKMLPKILFNITNEKPKLESDIRK
ncbi:MAG: hypothetical protein KAS75_05125 [Planctomycetes bacterium]|nr:hypothetical protein [Planctomycetota bacterium]